MRDVCDRCGKELSWRNSFVWNERRVCKLCLANLDSGSGWTDAPKEPTHFKWVKNPWLAFMLVIVLGPFGMIYVGRFWAAFLMEFLSWAALLVIAFVSSEFDGLFIQETFVLSIEHWIVVPIWAVVRANKISAVAMARASAVGPNSGLGDEVGE